MKYAQNRTDLSIITDVRSKLGYMASDLLSIDPEYARCVDEDYKVAEQHSFEMAELQKLWELAEACQAQAQVVLAGCGRLPFNAHLELVVAARKCCHSLASSTAAHSPKVERLIDPLDQLADKYAERHLGNLTKQELARAEEALLANQAKEILDALVKGLEQ